MHTMLTTSSIDHRATLAPERTEFKPLSSHSVSHSDWQARWGESVPVPELSVSEIGENTFGGDLRLDPASLREQATPSPPNDQPSDLLDCFLNYVTSPFSLPEKAEEEITLLAPLRERDTKALTALFEREDAEAIATEVCETLSWLHPEPCWEDHIFDFLQEYL